MRRRVLVKEKHIKSFLLILLNILASGFIACHAYDYAYRKGFNQAVRSMDNKIGLVKHNCQERVDTGVQIGCYRSVTYGCGDKQDCLKTGSNFCSIQVE